MRGRMEEKKCEWEITEYHTLNRAMEPSWAAIWYLICLTFQFWFRIFPLLSFPSCCSYTKWNQHYCQFVQILEMYRGILSSANFPRRWVEKSIWFSRKHKKMAKILFNPRNINWPKPPFWTRFFFKFPQNFSFFLPAVSLVYGKKSILHLK